MILCTTEEHPFWVPEVGWIAAKDLSTGTYLQTKTESWLDIDKIESHTSLTNVYNFEVEGFHTYFVSDLGLLVHNSCSDLPTASPALQGNPYHPDVVAERIKPSYKANPAHDPRSSNFNPRKTPEPNDASQVYNNATRADMGTWFGLNSDGKIYRFFSDNAGGVHFSGEVSSQLVPNNVLKQLQGKI
jgi:Pretoxin HINT domain